MSTHWSDLLKQLGLILVQVELLADLLGEHAHAHDLVTLLLLHLLVLLLYLCLELGLLRPEHLFASCDRLLELFNLVGQIVLLTLEQRHLLLVKLESERAR